MSAFTHAIVRAPAPSVAEGLRSGPEPPTYEGVRAEHRAYVAALEAAGLEVTMLEPLEDFPDSLFVEDPAFVLPEGAILLKPGACSRIGEVAALAPSLRERFERVLELDEGFADGGDILILPDEILIGRSGRTDKLGAKRFSELARTLGRHVRIVETSPDVLHLKTACALVGERTLVATPALAPLFSDYEVIVTPEGEESAANLLRINGTILIGADYPRTAELLAGKADIVPLPVAEIQRIDAGLSCMSLRW